MAINLGDPRVRKTRRGLQDAFIRLILRKGYDAVSIQDIADEADAARVTFYRHYRDKEELLTDCLNNLYEELAAKTERLSAAGLMSGYSPISTLYHHIEEHEDLYHVLFSSRGSQTVLERMRTLIATHARKGIERFLEQRPQAIPIPLEIIAYHVASAQLGLSIWWLDHGKPYPATYMAQISLWLSLVGLLDTFGMADFEPPLPVIET